MSINLVIACWSGERRVYDRVYVRQDRATYLRHQVEYLSMIHHNITQITFANNIPKHKIKKGYQQFWRRLPESIRGAKVVKIEQNNKGMSYGLFNLAYSLYRDSWTASR